MIRQVNTDLYLPAIQREFVWGTEKIERLFDSVMADFPIGSFLYWKLEQKNKDEWPVYEFIREYDADSPHNTIANLAGINKDITLVLDGHRRPHHATSRVRNQPADPQAGRRDLWLDEDGGEFPEDAIQRPGPDGACLVPGRRGVQPPPYRQAPHAGRRMNPRAASPIRNEHRKRNIERTVAPHPRTHFFSDLLGFAGETSINALRDESTRDCPWSQLRKLILVRGMPAPNVETRLLRVSEALQIWPTKAIREMLQQFELGGSSDLFLSRCHDRTEYEVA